MKRKKNTSQNNVISYSSLVISKQIVLAHFKVNGISLKYSPFSETKSTLLRMIHRIQCQQFLKGLFHLQKVSALQSEQVRIWLVGVFCVMVPAASVCYLLTCSSLSVSTLTLVKYTVCNSMAPSLFYINTSVLLMSIVGRGGANHICFIYCFVVQSVIMHCIFVSSSKRSLMPLQGVEPQHELHNTLNELPK